MAENIIRSSKEVSELIERDNWKIFGIGGVPLVRSEIWSFVPDYEIICSNTTGELASVREKIKVNVFDLEKTPGSKKSGDILTDKNVQEYIKEAGKGKKIAVYVLKSSKETEKVCRENGWVNISNEVELFKKVDDRDYFLSVLNRINEKRFFEVLKLSKFEESLADLFDKFGEEIVVQTFSSSGGSGTFKLKKGSSADIILEINKLKKEGDLNIIATSFIKGFDVASTGCVTADNSVFFGPARLQLVGIKEAVSVRENSKHTFCGNDWNLPENFSDEINKQYRALLVKIGDELKKDGFKGVFGVDFIFNVAERKLVPLEINPRLLGSYPVEVQVQKFYGEVPLTALHVLEFLGIKYKVLDKNICCNTNLKREVGQLTLFNFFGKDVVFRDSFLGGVYSVSDGELKFLRNGFELSDIKDGESEFILTDGVPVAGRRYNKNKQLLRIVWRRNIQVGMGSDIDEEAKNVVAVVKRELEKNIVFDEK